MQSFSCLAAGSWYAYPDADFSQFAGSVRVVKTQLPAKTLELLISISASLRVVRVVLSTPYVWRNIYKYSIWGRGVQLPATTRKLCYFRYLMAHFRPITTIRKPGGYGMSEAQALQERRHGLLEIIPKIADGIALIGCRLTILRSQELEADLI